MFVVAGDYSQQPYFIPGLDRLSPGTFDSQVAYWEEKYLRVLLGNLFYDALASGYNSISSIPVYDPTNAYQIGDQAIYVSANNADIYTCIQGCTGSQPDINPTYWTKQPVNRWVRFIYGDTYLYYNRPQKWYGMKRIVRPLIYYLWVRYNYDSPGVAGNAQQNTENATVISFAKRLKDAWNEYAELAAGDWPNVFDDATQLWPELENSLYGYLFLTDSTWADLVVPYTGFASFRAYLAYSFVYPGKSNVFGI